MVRLRFEGSVRRRLLVVSAMLVAGCGLWSQDAFPDGQTSELPPILSANPFRADYYAFRLIPDSEARGADPRAKSAYGLVPTPPWKELFSPSSKRTGLGSPLEVQVSPPRPLPGSLPDSPRAIVSPYREGRVLYSGRFPSPYSKYPTRLAAPLPPDLFSKGPDNSPLPTRPSAGLVISLEPDGRHSRGAFGCVVPMASPGAAIFGEANAQIADLCAPDRDSRTRRLDLSLGGGGRALCGGRTLLGANYFFDASRINTTWYSSAGFGFEAVFLVSKYSFKTLDVNLDFYKGGGVGVEVGYTVPVLQNICDLRTKVSKYRFHDGDFYVGWKAGVDLATPTRALAVTYEVGQDRNHQFGHTVGCSVSVPLSLGNLVRGRNPFAADSPTKPRQRDLRPALGHPVKRERHQPESVVAARNTETGKKWTVPVSLNYGKDSWPVSGDLVLWWGRKTEDNWDKYWKTRSTCRKLQNEGCAKWIDCECDRCCPECYKKRSLLITNPWWWAVGGASLVGLGVEHSYRCAFGPFKTDDGAAQERK
ncbi:MAG: hypothetical protein AB1646_00225 [Thermodesulfobacteriota bacterium]